MVTKSKPRSHLVFPPGKLCPVHCGHNLDMEDSEVTRAALEAAEAEAAGTIISAYNKQSQGEAEAK